MMDIGTKHLQPIVAIPARNEEERLGSLLAALARQTWSRQRTERLPVVIVLNNCRDRSRDVAREAASRFPSLDLHLIETDFPEELAHVGSARRLAMDRACDLIPTDDGVLLTTDADARPDADWVAANLRAIARGADLVGGKLYADAEEEARFGPGFAARAEAVARYGALRDRLAALIDPLDHDPWPRHGDHTGGSLAIRAALYRAVGGLPVLPVREDLALVAKARAEGGRLVHPLDVRVEVSVRLIGRAAGGMADCLKEWLRAEAEGLPLLVEDPALVEARLLRRKAIRDAGCLIRPGEKGRAHPAALVERFVPDEPDAPATMPVALAIARLTATIREWEGAAHAA